MPRNLTPPLSLLHVLPNKTSQGGPPVYRNMFHCMVTVGREEGLGGLYKGLTPALLRQAVYSSVRMGVYEPIRDVIQGAMR